MVTPDRTDLARSIGSDLLLITLELIPADVRRHAIRQEYLSILGSGRSPSRARPSGLVAPPVDRPDAIDIDAGVDRIAEQIPQ